MFRYTLSKLSLLGIVLFSIGCFFTVQGIIIRNNLTTARQSYEKTEIKSGRFLECDIAKEQLIGRYYTEPNGTINYGFYYNEDAITSLQTYLAAVNKASTYYVPLTISREYQANIAQIANDDSTYHLFGKFEKKPTVFNEIETDYDVIMEATGAKSKESVEQMISSQYRIKATDPKKEKEVLYKGLSLLAIGIIAFIWGIGKEKVVDMLAPHRQPWDIT